MNTLDLIRKADKWLAEETGSNCSNLSRKQALRAMVYFHQHLLKQCNVSGELPPDELLLSAIKYGYDYHKTTSFPNESFEDNMKGNALQWIENRRQ